MINKERVYRIALEVTDSIEVEVKAKSQKKAIEKAKGAIHPPTADDYEVSYIYDLEKAKKREKERIFGKIQPK